MRALLLLPGLILLAVVPPTSPSSRSSVSAPSASDSAVVAGLDTRYQAAVKANDWAGMVAILADDFILVTGTGKVFTKTDLVDAARNKEIVWEHQEDTQQTVRLWGNTAVVTALLWEKGVASGKPIDKRLWFSDTYVKTAAGWKYVFGQASLALP